MTFPKGDAAILDGLTIFHRKEPRDLTAAYQFYCQKDPGRGARRPGGRLGQPGGSFTRS